MKVKMSSQIDCEGNPVTATVEAEIPGLAEELELVLFDAMAEALRLLAKAARDDQQRAHNNQASS